MTRHFFSMAAVAGTLLLLSTPDCARAGEFIAATERAAPDEYLVVLRPESAKLSLESGDASQRALPTVRSVASQLGRSHQIEVVKVWDRALGGMLIKASAKAAERLAADPRVLAVEANFEHDLSDQIRSAPAGSCYGLDAHPLGTLFGRTPPASSPQTLTCPDPNPNNDTGSFSTPPVCRDNWGLDVIDQTSLTFNGQYTYDRTGSIPGQVNVTIMFLDSGISANHVDFKNAAGTATRASAIDFTGDTGCPATTDPFGHGTHVASIAAGRFFGVAKDAGILMLKTVTCSGFSFTSWMVDALNTAAGLRPGVVNWSGGNSTSIAGSTAVRNAVQGVINSGVLVVQSAGNQSSPYPQPGYSPAVYPSGVYSACDYSFFGQGALVVGGVDHLGKRWTRHWSGDLPDQFCVGANPDCGSNVGNCIGLWAPASNILAAEGPTNQTQTYCRLSGTSMAAPHAAGAAALYLQAHPLATAAQVATALINGATTGLLNTNTSTPNHIGAGSPNKLLFSKVP
jgi:hypothetical protein